MQNFTEDPWARTYTRNGFISEEIISSLQKKVSAEEKKKMHVHLRMSSISLLHRRRTSYGDD